MASGQCYALEQNNNQLYSAIDDLYFRLKCANAAIEQHLDMTTGPSKPWMTKMKKTHPVVVDTLRLKGVKDPRAIGNRSKRNWVLKFFEEETKIQAFHIWQYDNSKSAEQCWFEAQDKLFA